MNRIEHFKMIPPLERQTSPRGGDEMETVDDHVHNLLAVPETIGGKLWFLFTLPLRICFKFTLIDVRCVNPKLTKFGRCAHLRVVFVSTGGPADQTS